MCNIFNVCEMILIMNKCDINNINNNVIIIICNVIMIMINNNDINVLILY